MQFFLFPFSGVAVCRYMQETAFRHAIQKPAGW
jgi:hypothetical protein